MNAKEIVQWIRDREIQAVDLRFCDLPGLWQHVFTLPSELAEMDAGLEGNQRAHRRGRS